MRPTIGIVVAAAWAAFSLGCAKPAGPAFDEDQLRAHNLRTYWEARLPLERGESVLACHLLQEHVYCITNHASVFALHADAGVITWSRRLGGEGNTVFEPSASFGSGVDDAVVLTSQAGVWVVDRRSGELIGEVEVPFAPGGAAAASDELAWTGDLKGVMHATFPDGFDHWRFQTGGAIVAAPILLPDRVVFCSADGNVYCATPATKQRLWVFSADGPITATPAYNDDVLFVPSEDRRLYCVDIETGEMIWQYQASEPLRESPWVTHDTLYQSCGEGGLVALDIGTGSERWSLPQGRNFVARHRDTAYVRDQFGGLLAVDNGDGRVTWFYYPRDLDLAASNEEDSAMYLASHDGRVTCLRRLDVPYLRRSQVEAVLRSGRPGEAASELDAASIEVSASRTGARDPLASTSKVPPLGARAGGP